MMPKATMDVSPEILMSICVASQEGISARRFHVVENGLPKDVEFVSATLAGHTGRTVIRLTLKSESFTEGEALPPPVMKVVIG